MSSQDAPEYKPGLNWQRFCKAYAEYHGIKYSYAICEAGEAWKEYKAEHGITDSKSSKVGKQLPDVVVKRKDVPLGASGARIKNKIAVKPPPKGYKAVVTYVRDDEESSEEEIKEVVEAPKKVKLPPAKKPVMRSTVKKNVDVKAKPAPKKKAGLVKKKKEEVVIETVEESSEEEEGETEEESGSEEE